MTDDPIEAAALAILETDPYLETDSKVIAWAQAKAAIDAYHAAQPSDYTETIEELRHVANKKPGEVHYLPTKAADAIEALEADKTILKRLLEEARDRIIRGGDFLQKSELVKRVEAAEARAELEKDDD